MQTGEEFRLNNLQKTINGNHNVDPVQTHPLRKAQKLSGEPLTTRKVPERGQEDMVGVILKMQRYLFNHGKQRAIESGTLEPHSEDMSALEEHASAMARETQRDVYDPSQHVHDKLLDDEYKKLLSDRREAEQAEKFGVVKLRECEEEAAQAQASFPPPKQSIAISIAAVVAIMITVAPTLHDFVFVMADEVISWMISLLSGLFLGMLITLMILGDTDTSGHRTATNRIGLYAGILMGLALGGLRIKGATCLGDYIFAAAMTVLEIGIVLALEGIATSRRATHRDWSARKAVSDQANTRLEMAKAHLERCNERVKELNGAVNAHINYVEEREFRYSRIDEIEATALKAVRDGYHAGVAQNRGRILGVGGSNHE